ncbi:uncharacterized protein [Amphiura filiformis]|uniref:uncharacterized protein n=1 Tax=Amphiura filiformis TaxID=82378 RepID=UPI003B20DAD9
MTDSFSHRYDEVDSYHTLEELLMYDPGTDNWLVKEIGRRELEEWEESYDFDPSLYVYKDQLYRIMDQNEMSDHSISVSRVTLNSQNDGTMDMTVGEQLNRGNRPSGYGTPDSAFLIGDKEFSINYGVVCIDHEPQDLEPGKYFLEFPSKNLTSNPVWFKFDRKKLSTEYYAYSQE